MNAQKKRTVRFLCSVIACFLALSEVPQVSAQDVFLCVWRNPERTMTRLFPDALDYRTVNRPVSQAERQAIEKRTGSPLLPGQRDQFQYFEMTGKDGKALGYTVAASQKGGYGAIEFVLGLDRDFMVKGLYIQRSRERDNSFKARPFLDSFRGLSVSQADTLDALVPGEKTPGKAAVIQGVRKELTAFALLVLNR